MGYALVMQYPANKSTMDTKIATKTQIIQTDEGLLIYDDIKPWDSEGWSIGIEYILIKKDSVQVGISGEGDEILPQGLENEAEYARFQKEIEYSFEELGIDADFFEEYGDGAIHEIICFTVNQIMHDYQ